MEVLPTMDAVDAREWDAVVASDAIIRSHAFLRAVERSRIADVRFFHVVARDDSGRILGHTSAFSIPVNMDLFATGPMARATAAIRSSYPSFLRLRVLECGTPVAFGNLFSFAPDADRHALMDAFLDALDELGRREGIALQVVRDFTPAELPAFARLKDRGFAVVPNLPDCEIVNRWTSFDAYLKSMRSEYRYKVRRRMQRAAAAGVRCEIRTRFGDLKHRLAELWTATYARATEFRREILTADFFEEIDALGDRSRAVLLLQGDLVVAFAIVLVDDRTLRFLYTGLDYERNEEACLYFNLLYHVVRAGIELGRERIEMGITAYPPKMDVGGHRAPLLMFMKHASTFLSPAFCALYRLMTARHPDGGRRVFRDEPAPAAAAKGQRASR